MFFQLCIQGGKILFQSNKYGVTLSQIRLGTTCAKEKVQPLGPDKPKIKDIPLDYMT